MRAELFGLNIDTLSFDDAVKKAVELINTDSVSQVVTINPEIIYASEKNETLKKAIDEAELVFPDGVGVKIALKINGIPAERIPGIDFAKKMLEHCASNNLSVAIVGAKEEIIVKAIDNLRNEINNLNIVYYHNGYFNNDSEIYEEIKAHNPQMILVAMGAPRQEEFIYRAKSVLNRGLMIGIGGSLDVWSGVVKRAPLFFQKTGTEWLYRTVSQPERFKRIFPTLPLFLLKAIKYKFVK